MSSSDGACSSSLQLLDCLSEALNPVVLTQQVLEPIERATDDFQSTLALGDTRDGFLTVMGDFVAHLFWEGMFPPVQMSPTHARTKALQLLEDQYEGVFATGYAGAYLDATRAEGPGLGAVLVELASLIAKEQIGRRGASVLAILINPGDWAGQLRLVEQLIVRLGPHLPPHLAGRPAESLVSAYRELLALFLEAEGFLTSTHLLKPASALLRNESRENQGGRRR